MSTKRGLRAVALLGAVAIAALIIWYVTGNRPPRAVPDSAVAVTVGKNPSPVATGGLAPPFTLPGFEGQTVTLSQFRGKPIVINFWASWCGPCRAEAPNLERAWQTYKSRGVIFLGVDIEDSEGDAREFIAAFNVSYPNVRDPSQHVMTAYKIAAIPTTLFIDREGRIRQRYAGGFLGESGSTQLSTWIEELLR